MFSIVKEKLPHDPITKDTDGKDCKSSDPKGKMASTANAVS